VTTQVVERHIVRGLETIFCPVSVNTLEDKDIMRLVSEPLSTRKQRNFLDERIKKLEVGQEILKGVMGGSVL